MTAMLETVRDKLNKCTLVTRLNKQGCRIPLKGGAEVPPDHGF